MPHQAVWEQVKADVEATHSHLDGEFSMLPSENDARNYCRFYRLNKSRKVYYSIAERPNKGKPDGQAV